MGLGQAYTKDGLSAFKPLLKCYLLTVLRQGACILHSIPQPSLAYQCFLSISHTCALSPGSRPPSAPACIHHCCSPSSLFTTLLQDVSKKRGRGGGCPNSAVQQRVGKQICWIEAGNKISLKTRFLQDPAMQVGGALTSCASRVCDGASILCRVTGWESARLDFERTSY